MGFERVVDHVGIRKSESVGSLLWRLWKREDDDEDGLRGENEEREGREFVRPLYGVSGSVLW